MGGVVLGMNVEIFIDDDMLVDCCCCKVCEVIIDVVEVIFLSEGEEGILMCCFVEVIDYSLVVIYKYFLFKDDLFEVIWDLFFECLLKCIYEVIEEGGEIIWLCSCCMKVYIEIGLEEFNYYMMVFFVFVCMEFYVYLEDEMVY